MANKKLGIGEPLINKKFKSSKLNELFSLVNKGITDTVFNNGNTVFSMAVMNDDNYIENYIKRLRNRYNINVGEEVIRLYKNNEDNNIKRKAKLGDEDLFKIIRVPRSTKNDLKSMLAKEKYIYISLVN